MGKQVDLPGVARVRVRIDSEAAAALPGALQEQVKQKSVLDYTDWRGDVPPPCTGFWDVTVYALDKTVNADEYDRLWVTVAEEPEEVSGYPAVMLRLPSGLVVPWRGTPLRWRGLRAPWHAGYPYKVAGAVCNQAAHLDDDLTYKGEPYKELKVSRPRVRL